MKFEMRVIGPYYIPSVTGRDEHEAWSYEVMFVTTTNEAAQLTIEILGERDERLDRMAHLNMESALRHRDDFYHVLPANLHIRGGDVIL